MIWGMSFDETMEDEVQVTIIATGFEEQSTDPVIKTPARDLLGRRAEGTPRVTESFIDRAVRTSTQADD
jgi:cell division GTPase FtsZ